MATGNDKLSEIIARLKADCDANGVDCTTLEGPSEALHEALLFRDRATEDAMTVVIRRPAAADDVAPQQLLTTLLLLAKHAALATMVHLILWRILNGGN